MKPLVIAETAKTPFVYFNPEEGKFLIGGTSIPQNASAFYGSVIKWMDDYLENSSNDTQLRLIIEEINTGSVEYLFQLLKTLDKHYLKGKSLLVKWFYDERDGKMLEIISFFRKELHIPINDIKIDFVDKINN